MLGAVDGDEDAMQLELAEGLGPLVGGDAHEAAPCVLVVGVACSRAMSIPLLLPSGTSRISATATRAISPSGAATRKISATPVP